MTTAYLTHASMRNLTVLTDQLRESTVEIEGRRSGEQLVLSGGGEDCEIVSVYFFGAYEIYSPSSTPISR